MAIVESWISYDAKDISADLRNLQAQRGQARSAKWPKYLEVSRDSASGRNFRIEMSQELVLKNMQEDSAAFEGWVMVLRCWFKAETVSLSWTRPTAKTYDLHYQRFLYRVIRFQEAMQDWFIVSDKNYLSDSRLLYPDGGLREGDYWLNYEMVSRNDDSKEDDPFSSEDALERAFCRNPTSLLACSNAEYGLNRQLPVGLFLGEVKKNSKESNPQVFPGGKAAIDLWSIKENGKTIIYELKIPKGEKKNNKKVGVISELFFYASLLRDLQKSDNLKFYIPKSNKPYNSTINKIRAGKGVDAYVLIDDIHPLLDGEVFLLLNESFAGSELHFGYISYNNNFDCTKIYG